MGERGVDAVWAQVGGAALVCYNRRIIVREMFSEVQRSRFDLFMRRWGIWLVLLLTVVLLANSLQRVLQFTNGELGVPLDDAWIHFQFARNLGNGNGFSYIANRPTPGSTAPLWTILLTPVGWFSDQFVGPAMLLSACFLLLTVYLTYRLTLTLTGGDLFAALLAALGTSLAGRLLWAGLSGMEVTAFAACSLAALWVYARGGLTAWAALLFALAGQLRPEGHLLFALVVADGLVSMRWPQNSAEKPITVRNLIVAVLIYGLVALPYTIFSLSVTGKPLPNTFYAKTGGSALYSFDTLRGMAALHWQDNIIASILALIGLVPLWRRSRIIVLWLLVLLLAVPALVEVVWHHGRYTMPLIPLQMIAAVFGARWLIARMPQRLRALGWGVALGLVLVSGVYRLSYWSGMLGYNVREIRDIDVRMGEWLAANTPADAVIAVDDIGAIGFLSEREIVDLLGLVTPEMWPVLADADVASAEFKLMHTLGVDYMAIFPDWHSGITAAPGVTNQLQLFTTESHTIVGRPEAGIYTIAWPYMAEATPQHPRDTVFGESIRFSGFDWDFSAEMPELTIYWESVQPLDKRLHVFLHVVDAQGAIVAQIDREPNDGLTPVNRWQTGDIITDSYTIPLPSDLPAADHTIRMGIYSQETSSRLLTDTGADWIEVMSFRPK
ncbi:MAG: hypothetical protein M9941_04720 [Anaerolineae bacterium]|nr:hypothetical protein [Anaerolineae bacterium]